MPNPNPNLNPNPTPSQVISGLTLNGRAEGRLPRWRCRVRVQTFYADM